MSTPTLRKLVRCCQCYSRQYSGTGYPSQVRFEHAGERVLLFGDTLCLLKLPAVVLLVAKLDEQVTGLLLENAPVTLGEHASPIARYALPEEGSGVLLAPLPAFR